MSDRVKLIWDFHGAQAKPTAEHHVKHLGEYAQAENIQNKILGVEQVGPMHFIAFFVVDKIMMDSLRQILKPNRGQFYEE